MLLFLHFFKTGKKKYLGLSRNSPKAHIDISHVLLTGQKIGLINPWGVRSSGEALSPSLFPTPFCLQPNDIASSCLHSHWKRNPSEQFYSIDHGSHTARHLGGQSPFLQYSCSPIWRHYQKHRTMEYVQIECCFSLKLWKGVAVLICRFSKIIVQQIDRKMWELLGKEASSWYS